MKVAFIEFSEEIEPFLEHCRNTNLEIHDVKVIALSLRVQAALKRKSIPFENTLPFFNNLSHESCLLKSDEIVRSLERELNVTEIIEDIIFHKRWYIFLLRHFVNHLLWLIEIMENAIDQYSPKYIISPRYDQMSYDQPFITDKESYLLALTSLVAQRRFIVNESFAVSKTMNHTSAVEPKYSGLWLRWFKQQFFQRLLMRTIKNEKTILVLGTGYNLDRVLNMIKRWDHSIKIVKLGFNDSPIRGIDYHLDGALISEDDSLVSLRRDIKGFFKVLKSDKQLFTYREINFWELMINRASNGIHDDVKLLAEKQSRLKSTLKEVKPDLSLSISSRHLTYALGELCRSHELNALCISHGTVVPPKNEIEKIVNRNIGLSVILNKYPSVALQTPWAERFFDHYNTLSEKVITGPLVFSNGIHPRTKNNQKTILHAVTLKTRHSIKFWGVEHIDEFISSLSSLIKVVHLLDDVTLIVKLHPAYVREFTKEELDSLLPKSDSYVISDASLSDELSRADLVMSFSSTIIEESLINRIPVLLYDHWNRYKHFDALDLNVNLFKPFPVYYVNNPRILESKLTTILEKGLSDKVNSKDWEEYSFPPGSEEGFYNYLKQCFTVTA
mgnify:FL=1